MIVRLFTLAVFLFLGSFVHAQIDTVYFNARWQSADSDNFNYYRIYEVKGDRIEIVDYYNNGAKQMTGAVANTEENLELAKSSQDLDGEEIGEYVWYNQNGSVYTSTDFDPNLSANLDSTKINAVHPDSLIYQRTYFTNGVVKEEGLMTLDGIEHGRWIKRNKKGIKTSEGNYNNGILDGTYYCYYFDGTLLFTAEYKDGKKHGEYIDYSPNGKVKKRRVFKNGELVSKERPI